MKTHLVITSAALAALALAGCGKQGELDRPAPLVGAKAKAEYRAQKAAAGRSGTTSSDSSATSQTNGDYSQDKDGAKDPGLRPLRSDPIPGASNPFGNRPPSGVLPDPYNDPNRVPR
jgi:predicted small lipoprotein YifL